MEDLAVKAINEQIEQSLRTANRNFYYYIGNKLIKKRKPCFDGDYIHLHSMDGCYRVTYCCARYFIIMKNHEPRKCKWTDFRCHKGQGVSDLKKVKKTNAKLNMVLAYLNSIREEIRRV